MRLNLFENCQGDAGATLLHKIQPKLNMGQSVLIDFRAVKSVDASFLFHAFGRLHETLPIVTVRDKLHVVFGEEQEAIQFLYKNVMVYSEAFYLDSRFRFEALNFIKQNQNKKG